MHTLIQYTDRTACQTAVREMGEPGFAKIPGAVEPIRPRSVAVRGYGGAETPATSGWGTLRLGVLRRLAVLGLVVSAASVASAASADISAAPGDAAVEQLRGLSIEDLAKIPVTTVSRREESLAQAPAAAYVIT